MITPGETSQAISCNPRGEEREVEDGNKGEERPRRGEKVWGEGGKVHSAAVKCNS